MKDYYSLEEKRSYYRWRKINPRVPKTKRDYASRRYDSLKNYKIPTYKPRFIRRAKTYTTTVGNFIDKLKKMKHHWDFLGNKRQSLIDKTQYKHSQELKCFDNFRTRHQLSLKDDVYIDKTK